MGEQASAGQAARRGRIIGGECDASVELAFELPFAGDTPLKLELLSDAMEGLDRELVVPGTI